MDDYGNQRGRYQGGGGEDDEDLRGAADAASRHAGDSGDSDMFGGILNAISQRKGHIANNQDVDEDAAVQHHQQYFGGNNNDDGGGRQATSGGMGAAAAMQALKMFGGGGGGQSQSQSQFIGMAMGEASKLFEQQSSQGRVSDGSSKESVVQEAGEMALKMYLKSQGGGGGGGGISSLMGMASKFL